MKRSTLLLLLSLAAVASAAADAADGDGPQHRRLKRSAITFPSNTTFRIVLDLIMPIGPLLNSTQTTLTFDLPFKFRVPTYDQMADLYSSLGKLKRSDIDVDYNFLEEHRANEDRRGVFRAVQDVFRKFGYDGPACVRRAICELTEAPLGHSGLVGQLVQLLLPSLLEFPKSMEGQFGPGGAARRLRRDENGLDALSFVEAAVEDEYTDAHRDGQRGQCRAKYHAQCPVSLFTIISP